MATIFPVDMLDTKRKTLTLDCIVKDMAYFLEQTQLLHWNTTNYAEHKALDSFISNIRDIRDDVVERIIGYTGVRPKGFIMSPVATTITPSVLVASVLSFAEQLQEYGKTNKMPDIENIAQSLSGNAAQTKYLLTLS